jgi:hypothetical protein
MASNALALRMKYRKFDAEKLEEIINDENSSELEVKVAQEFLDKLGGETAQEEEAPKKAPAKKSAPKKEDKKVPTKKAAPKKEETADDDPDPEDGSPEAAMKRQNKRNSTYQSEEQLTPEEEERLAKAEAEYEERQKNRKTPSKSDKSMKEKKSAKADKTPRETKRQNLEESEEIPGLKVGSKVTLKGEDAVGEITRLYKSGDGKEKCMVKFGDDKPIKKRVTALELAEDAKPAPAKKTPKKK